MHEIQKKAQKAATAYLLDRAKRLRKGDRK